MFFQLGVALSLLTDFNLKQTKISSSQTWLLINGVQVSYYWSINFNWSKVRKGKHAWLKISFFSPDSLNLLFPSPTLLIFDSRPPPWTTFFLFPAFCCHWNQRWPLYVSLRKCRALNRQNYASFAGSLKISTQWIAHHVSFALISIKYQITH